MNTHEDGYEWIPSLSGILRMFASNEAQGTVLSPPLTKPRTAQKFSIPGNPLPVLIISRTPYPATPFVVDRLGAVAVLAVDVNGAVDGEIQLPGIAPDPDVIIVVIVVDAGMALPLGMITIVVLLIVVVVSEATDGAGMVLPLTTTEPESRR